MNLAALSLSAAHRQLRQRQLSSVELAEFYLKQIIQYDSALNAFITVTAESAREEAKRADTERARGVERGPLHGIPIALKDLFDQRGVPTTAGSRILRDNIATRDAEVTARLRDAGAVLLGKTNMHEFAFGTTNVNPHFGNASNPWALSHIPGGSSGGSAAAVAARLCLGALGTDTGGSIRIPAALCGVTGIKPTYGRVSLRGVIPLSWSNDHAGPLTQSAEDAALCLTAIAGYDPDDPVSVNQPKENFVTGLYESLRGMKFSAPHDYFESQVDDEILHAVGEAVQGFQVLGAIRVQAELPAAPSMFDTNRILLRAEAAAYHQAELESRPEDFGADVLVRLNAGQKVTGEDYALARRRQAELIRKLELFFEDVDFLVTPVTRAPAPTQDTDPVAMAQHLTMFTAPFNVTGFPALSIPCGFTRAGLPIGLQIVGRKWDEARILQVAHQYQLTTDWHTRIPSFA